MTLHDQIRAITQCDTILQTFAVLNQKGMFSNTPGVFENGGFSKRYTTIVAHQISTIFPR